MFQCKFICGRPDTIPNQCDFNDLEVLSLSPSGYRLIRNMQQEIEPRLKDKGDLSHDMLRGFAGKMNMQVMKIASLLHVFSPNKNNSVINDIYVKAAINIVTELLEATRSMLKAKGIIGAKAAFETIIRKLGKGKPVKERSLIIDCHQCLPFKAMSGNKSDSIKAALARMESQGLCKSTSNGKTKEWSLV